MEHINVYFRKFPDGDVIALWDDTGDSMISSYMRIGQHCEAHYTLISELKPASESEYKSLKNELESLGYVVNIVR